MSISPAGKPLCSELQRVMIFRLLQGDPMSLAAAGLDVELLPHNPGESISSQGEAYKVIVSVELIYLLFKKPKNQTRLYLVTGRRLED